MRSIAFLLFCTLQVYGQKTISLAQAWHLVEQNPQILQKSEEILLATADLHLTQRLRLPVINAQYQSPISGFR